MSLRFGRSGDGVVALLSALVVICLQTILCPDASAQVALSADVERAPQEEPGLKVLTITSTRTKSSHILSVRRMIGAQLSLGLSAEYFWSSSEYYQLGRMGDRPAWKFRSIPITISVERQFVPTSHRFVPFASVGVSCYFSRARTRTLVEVAPGFDAQETAYDAQTGVGYGGLIELGVKSRLTSRTFVQAQGRYRLVDGLAMGSSERAMGQFRQFDFAVGVGVSF